MRIPGWNEALAAEFERAQMRPFRWGRHDCCQFVARVAAAVTGTDRRAMFAVYRSRREAAEILADCGGMAGLLTKAFGEPVHVSRAGVGDVVLIDMGRGEQPAVCMGVNSFAPGRHNLEPWPTRLARLAWLT